MDEQKNDTPMIPLHQAETTFMHIGWANRRMLIALICVCVTFIITILVFVIGYTKREENWQATVKSLWAETKSAEATDGIQQQPDP